MGTGISGYLDELVINHLARNVGYVLQEVDEWDRSAAFLGLGMEQQRHFIEDTLREFSSESLPDGYFYVMLPNDCFKYKKSGSNIKSHKIQSSKGRATLCGALDEIEREIGASSSIVALFYNHKAKEEFEQKIKSRLPKLFINTTELQIPDYGRMILDSYSATEPSIAQTKTNP